MSSYLRWALFSLMVGSVVGLLMVQFKPIEWEATAEIQIGQIGHLSFTNNAAVGIQVTQLESPLVTYERLTAPGFLRAVVRRAGMPELSDRLMGRYVFGSGKLDVRSIRGTDLLILKLRHESQSQAAQLMDATVAELIEEHTAMMEPFEKAMAATKPPAVNRKDHGGGEVTMTGVQLAVSQTAPFTRATRLIAPVTVLEASQKARVLSGIGVALLMSLLVFLLLYLARAIISGHKNDA